MNLQGIWTIISYSSEFINIVSPDILYSQSISEKRPISDPLNPQTNQPEVLPNVCAHYSQGTLFELSAKRFSLALPLVYYPATVALTQLTHTSFHTYQFCTFSKNVQGRTEFYDLTQCRFRLSCLSNNSIKFVEEGRNPSGLLECPRPFFFFRVLLSSPSYIREQSKGFFFRSGLSKNRTSPHSWWNKCT